MAEHVDVIIVGAGLSGIGAAYHLQKRCPNKSIAILEARAASGGTWDLFRYPGVRSDSDMFTLGYNWRPWRGAKAIAEGKLILDYVRDAAREHGIDKKIRYQHRLVHAAWSSDRGRWTLEIERGEGREPERLTCKFLYMCPGYYDYDAGYLPTFEGERDFAGVRVHPQHWPEDLDYSGKRVVVIGSGATAMTLVPKLAERAAHVTMVQRSPTYVVSMPARDVVGDALRSRLPAQLAYQMTRWKNVLFGSMVYQVTQRAPQLAKRRLIDRVKAELGPDYDVDKHFTPRYDPWNQRLCLVPDSDLFEVLRSGRATVETEAIERFTSKGLRLASGKELEADIIVTATGLELKFLGGAQLTVDGKTITPSQHLNYKGCMFSDVPNMCCVFGYTNASWTLKADLVAEFICRVLRTMDKNGADRVVPRRDPAINEQPWLSFSSGYVQRSLSLFPKQGDRHPFKLYQNYFLDLLMLRYGRVEDGTLEFTATPERKPVAKRRFSLRPRPHA